MKNHFPNPATDIPLLAIYRGGTGSPDLNLEMDMKQTSQKQPRNVEPKTKNNPGWPSKNYKKKSGDKRLNAETGKSKTSQGD